MPFLREQPSGVWRICQGSQHHLHRRFCATAARSCTLSTRQAFCCSSLSPLLTLPCLPAPGACHKKNYDNRDTVCRMLKAQNFQITAQGLELPDGISPLKSVPSELVPHCPVCGAPMSMNLRADDTFVEDEGWHEAAGNYEDFLRAHKGEHILFWKFGCRRKHSRHHQIPLLAHNLSESEGPLCLHQSFGGLLSQGNPRAGHLH